MSSEFKIETQQKGTTGELQTGANAKMLDDYYFDQMKTSIPPNIVMVGKLSVQESPATVNTVKDTSQGTTVPIILGMMSNF